MSDPASEPILGADRRGAPISPDWIAVDWGTSSLRVWAMDAAGTVRVARSSRDGMGAIAPQAFEAALRALIHDLLSPDCAVPVIICGMAGARQGWVEAPYRAVPCTPVDGAMAVVAPCGDPRLAVRILPGLRQDAPPDVMRGEETLLAGFLGAEPDFEGAVCLPGTHSKWARLSRGQVTAFSTAMTGEVFALLADHSTLRHVIDDGWDDDAFTAGLDDGATGLLATELFAIRALGLLAPAGPGAARARLSGLLIGAELAAMARFMDDGPVALIGAPALLRRYGHALARVGRSVRTFDAEPLAIAGLSAARRSLVRDTR